MVTRRTALLASLGALGGSSMALSPLSAATTTTTHADWPRWAPARAAVAAKIASLRSRAADLRRFGARLDGSSDDTDALHRAYASGAPAVLVSGPMRLSRPLVIDRPFALIGVGPGTHIEWVGPGAPAALVIQSASPDDPATFVRDVVIAGISAHRATTAGKLFVLIQAINIRSLTIAGCTTANMGLATVKHRRMANRTYKRENGSLDIDPAIVAGFSPTTLDDLNEDIVCLDNTVDNGVYSAPVLRFEMARRVCVSGNRGRFANVSWWGGGGKAKEGGQARFLRRVRDVYIADNTLSGSMGNIYGNNGQNVIVARNAVSDATDTAIDFEGCIDCHAYDNTVKNAGNFGLSTFFVARNILFERNVVEQDGTATTMAKRFGVGQIGGGKGIALVALRSGGFGNSKDISVRFVGNRLAYTAPTGIGICLSSYFESLEFEDNVLHNVSCDWRYSFTKRLLIRNNRLTFDRPPPLPAALIAGSANSAQISGNQLRIDAAMPQDSVAIGYEMRMSNGQVDITGNAATGPGAAGLAIAVNPAREKANGTLVVQDNAIDAISLDRAIEPVAKLARPARRHIPPVAIPAYPPPPKRPLPGT